MGMGHSMNKDQVENVLSNFENTMKAIKGIEQKADRVNEMLCETQSQQDALHGQMDRAQDFVKNVTESLNLRSSQVLHFRDSLEGIVGVVEKLEDTLYDLGLRDLPGKIQRELGPIFVPVLVLTLIVTISNCAFGFLLATDAELALEGGTMNMVNMFATIHVVLIGLAVLHLVVEVVLRVLKAHRRRRAAESREEHMQAGDDDGAELFDEEEHPAPRPRSNSDPGVVTVASPPTPEGGPVVASRSAEPVVVESPKPIPSRISATQDVRRGQKSTTSHASKETDSSLQGMPKRTTTTGSEAHSEAASSPLASPSRRPKAAISGMLRVALQQGVSLHSSDSRSSIDGSRRSESSGPHGDRMMSAFQAMKKGMEKAIKKDNSVPSLRHQGTASDVGSEFGGPRVLSMDSDGMDDNPTQGDGPSIGSI